MNDYTLYDPLDLDQPYSDSELFHEQRDFKGRCEIADKIINNRLQWDFFDAGTRFDGTKPSKPKLPRRWEPDFLTNLRRKKTHPKQSDVNLALRLVLDMAVAGYSARETAEIIGFSLGWVQRRKRELIASGAMPGYPGE